jgi:hypothetical protein
MVSQDLSASPSKVVISGASIAAEEIGFVSQKSGAPRLLSLCVDGVSRAQARTPGPPPFSSMTSGNFDTNLAIRERS